MKELESMTDTVTVTLTNRSGEEDVTLSQNAVQVLLGLTELWEIGLVSADEDVTGYAGYEDEVVVECPATVTFKGRRVALALNEIKNTQPTS